MGISNMKLYKRAKQIIEDIMPRVYNNAKAAEKITCSHLQALIEAVEPHMNELKDEVAMLREVLADTYSPSSDEMVSWYEHCNQISACGGNPPDELDHWAEVAINRWECRQV